MAKGKQKAGKPRRKKEGKLLPALCNLFGTLLLLAVIGLCVPLTVPQFMGYQVYNIVSGSMEPAIAQGSVVLVKPAEPAEVLEGDVIAFNDGESAVVHRVVTNRTSLGEFVTKGDANDTEDFNPVPYDALLGKVEVKVPFWGTFMTIYSSVAGKIYLLMAAACGVMLNVLAGRVRESRRARRKQAEAAEALKAAGAALQAGRATGEGALGADARVEGAMRAGAANAPGVAAVQAARGAVTSGAGADGARAGCAHAGAGAGASDGPVSREDMRADLELPRRKRSIGRMLVRVFAVLLGAVFVGSAGVVGYVTWQYSASDATYKAAGEKFVTKVEAAGEKAPISVDFDSLLKENPDIVGWIYCEDTPIDYPVLQGETNDQYLHHDYLGEYNIDGSIFADADNARHFADSNTIVYGHHMNSGSMFASLVNWADQGFFDEHPIVWLLTPTQDYKIVLFSGHHADAYSNYYDIYADYDAALDGFLGQALLDSDFDAGSQYEELRPLAEEAVRAADEAKAAEEAARAAAAAGSGVAAGGSAAAGGSDGASAGTGTRAIAATDAAPGTALPAALDDKGSAVANTQSTTRFSSLLAQAVMKSDQARGLALTSQPHYVMLTTCAYLFDNDRYVLHGLLVPLQ